MTRRKKLLLTVGLAMLALVAWLLWPRKAGAGGLFGSKAAPWTNGDLQTVNGKTYPSWDRASPHFSWKELLPTGTTGITWAPPAPVPQDRGFQLVLRGARYLEHLRQLRGDLAFTAKLTAWPGDKAASVVFVAKPLPGQSLDAFRQLVNETVSADLSAAKGVPAQVEFTPDANGMPIWLEAEILGL